MARSSSRILDRHGLRGPPAVTLRPLLVLPGLVIGYMTVTFLSFASDRDPQVGVGPDAPIRDRSLSLQDDSGC